MIVAQRVNDIEQSPKIFKKFVAFLHATEESAIEEKVRDVVAHRACRVPPVGSGRRHLLSIGNAPRFSCCHPAGDHRGGAYPRGHQSLTRAPSEPHPPEGCRTALSVEMKGSGMALNRCRIPTLKYKAVKPSNSRHALLLAAALHGSLSPPGAQASTKLVRPFIGGFKDDAPALPTHRNFALRSTLTRFRKPDRFTASILERVRAHGVHGVSLDSSLDRVTPGVRALVRRTAIITGCRRQSGGLNG